VKVEHSPLDSEGQVSRARERRGEHRGESTEDKGRRSEEHRGQREHRGESTEVRGSTEESTEVEHEHMSRVEHVSKAGRAQRRARRA
jgi:hypothetical protein